MSTNIATRLNVFAPHVLSLFRAVFGLLLLMHGTQKLFGWPVALPTGTVPVGTWPFWYAGIIEVTVGLLLVTGLFTRAAAFLGSGTMAFAYFTQHQPAGFWPIENGGELAVLNCFGFFLLVFTGGGAIALDALRRRDPS